MSQIIQPVKKKEFQSITLFCLSCVMYLLSGSRCINDGRLFSDQMLVGGEKVYFSRTYKNGRYVGKG